MTRKQQWRMNVELARYAFAQTGAPKIDREAVRIEVSNLVRVAIEASLLHGTYRGMLTALDRYEKSVAVLARS